MPTARKKAAERAPLPIVEFGGKSLTFALGVNEWCDAEAHFRKPTSDILAEIAERPSIGTLRYLIASGLSDADSVYSHTEAGDVIAEIGMPAAIDLIGDSMSRIMGGLDA